MLSTRQESNFSFVKVSPTSGKVVVRHRMQKAKIIGPHFCFEPAVTGENYMKILCYYAMFKMLQATAYPIIQQNGAPPHWAADVKNYFDTKLRQP